VERAPHPKRSRPAWIIDKRREGQPGAHDLIGTCTQDAVVIDDMIDTAGTLLQAVEASRVKALAHLPRSSRSPLRTRDRPIKSSPWKRSSSQLHAVVGRQATGRLTVLTVAPLLGEAIRRITTRIGLDPVL